MAFSVSFIIVKMETESISDYIFDTLIKLLTEAVKKEDLDVAIEVVNVLTEICEEFYFKLMKYHQIIFEEIFFSLNLV